MRILSVMHWKMPDHTQHKSCQGCKDFNTVTTQVTTKNIYTLQFTIFYSRVSLTCRFDIVYLYHYMGNEVHGTTYLDLLTARMFSVQCAGRTSRIFGQRTVRSVSLQLRHTLQPGNHKA